MQACRGDHRTVLTPRLTETMCSLPGTLMSKRITATGMVVAHNETAPLALQGKATLHQQPKGTRKIMTAANTRFAGLTAGQVRDIYRNKNGLTIRQLAIKYGVPERVINEARLYQSRRANPGKRGRVALVNA